MVVGSRQVGVQ